MATLAMALIPLSGCTGGATSGPRPSGATATTAVEPSMTAAPEAAQCALHRDLGRGTDAGLPIKDLFPKGSVPSIEVNDEFRPGADADDDVKCGNELPDADDVWCWQAAPWASLDWTDLVNASGASRIRRVGLGTHEGDPASSGTAASRWVWYAEIELAGTDRKGLVDFIRSAFQQCADGSVSVVHGVPAVTGAVPPMRNSTVDAHTVAFLTPTRVAWVILDGHPWTARERERVLAAIAAHLQAA